jgi:hypothetical protein
MVKKQVRKIKVRRNGDVVDPQSTQIREDQAEKLKQDRPPSVREGSSDGRINLVTKNPIPLYTTGKEILCNGCERSSPTKVMYRYDKSSHGKIVLCEECIADAEKLSFYGLDALDPVWLQKQYKSDE